MRGFKGIKTLRIIAKNYFTDFTYCAFFFFFRMLSPAINGGPLYSKSWYLKKIA